MKFKRRLLPVILVLQLILLYSCNLGKNSQTLYADGVVEAKNGKLGVAYKLFKKAAEKEPKNNQYLWAAANTAPDQNAAFIHTKAAWENGFKTPLVLLRLAAVAFHTTSTQKMEYALSLYKELPDSTRKDEFRGSIFFQFAQFDSALAVYKNIEKNGPVHPELCNKIALCYEKKGMIDSVFTYLIECKRKRQLNSVGYSMLATILSVQYDYSQIDQMYEDALASGVTSGALKLEYSYSLIARKKFVEADRLLKDILNSDSESLYMKYQSSLISIYIRVLQKDIDEMKVVSTNTTDSSTPAQVIGEYNNFSLNRFTDTTKALEKIKALKKKAPFSPVIELSYAVELIRTGQYPQADSAFRRLPQSLLFSPMVVVEYSANLLKIGKDDEAIKLISNLHSHGIMSKSSLELFRDLSYKKKMFDKSTAAQKLLEKQFKNDAGVMWSSGILFLRAGKYDSAITVFTSLTKMNPSEVQFEIMRLNCLFLKGDLKVLLQACSTSTAPELPRKLLVARALRKNGGIEDVKNAYEDVLAIAKDTIYEPHLEYAQYLLEIGDSQKASIVFSKLLSIYEKSPKQDTVALAMILNNFAWTGLQSGTQDMKTVTDAAKKAFNLKPGNPQITDTYAAVLNKSGKYKECVVLLENKSFTKKDPHLLLHLGLAFEKNGDINKAVRSYQDILALPDSTGGLAAQIEKTKLIEHVKTLQSQKNTH